MDNALLYYHSLFQLKTFYRQKKVYFSRLFLDVVILIPEERAHQSASWELFH